ncbi:MAG: aspartyl-tRNA(Asn)/glutamyl-tRNA (Gln) amidotransferase subunit C [Parcubacteria group bacterium Gr01-1014_33]|nr:MAG: aspartyl-tRNA(Asn)/glutamyl-tRNA (Gln) amidotransferase subunit C [Parcubacteria group bacterium Gr01-1014_33]
MPITSRDVIHIAHLARIELTPEEEKKFTDDLSAILGFVEELNQVDTEHIEPMTGGTALENIMRKDQEREEDTNGKPQKLLEEAPETERGYVKVKAVFEYT